MSARDPHAPAPGWLSALPSGSWLRGLHGGVPAEVRAVRAPGPLRYEMRVGDGPWLAAGETLRCATEHAGGHAVRLELMAARGGQDLAGPCVICARMSAKGDGR